MADIDPDLLTLGRELARLRKESKLSQEQLAERCRMTRNYIGFVERGERNPSLKTLVLLARALGVPPSALLATLD